MSRTAPSRPYTPPNDPRLPRFSSFEEEADFWDTHDVFDLSRIPPDELSKRCAIEEARLGERAGRANLAEG